jgi:pimeloyl-ACP methyl ester carboxylesterase
MDIKIDSAAGGVTLTIPLQITISLGAPLSGPGQPLVAGELEGSRAAAIPAAEAEFSVESLAAAEFTWRTALSLAMASNLAYSPRSTVEGTGATWGLSNCRFVEAVDTQCFIASMPDAVLVAFRGTESIRDWLADLNARRVTRDYGLVHRGFYHAFNDVRLQLEAILASLPGRRVVLTGHSLGGAIATVAAAEWLNAGSFRIGSVYTYGQPRVGNEAFRQYLNGKVGESFSRFVNDDDLVTRVPPGFKHVGKVFHFDASGDLQNRTEAAAASTLEATAPDTASTEPPPLTEAQFDQLRAELLAARQGSSLEAMPESAIATPELEGFFPSIRDHSMSNYIRKILRHVG